MQTGTTLGHYRITAKLGEGGMGQVFRAEDVRLKRDVAIKVLPAEVAGDSERIARMEREAQVLASLEHPNIASIYGLEEATVDGVPIRFLAMQLAEGRTLADRIAEGPVPLNESLQIALQIAEGLEAAHEKGVIHRDLKPANIQLGSDGTVKLLDFGLAKAVDGGGKSSTDLTASPTVLEATRQGVILGTAAYMSPEQARGQRVDRRTDIWAYGAVLFEMLSGTQVFGGPTATDVLGGIVHKEPDWKLLPEGTPRRIQVLLKRCLRKDPKRRLQAVGDARVTIVDYLEDPVAAEGLVGAETAPAWKRLLPWGAAAVLALALAASMLIGGQAATPPLAIRMEVTLDVTAILGDLGANVLLSPDGRNIVVATGRAVGEEDLWVRRLDDVKFTRLTGGGAYEPFFSPDGQWVGFVTPGTLQKVPIAGGTPQRIADANRARGATWGPDGTIVFAASAESGLVKVRADGGEVQPVTELAEGEFTHRWPQFLPDGRHVLFTSHTLGSNFDNAALEVVDLQSGERKLVHRGGSYGRYVESGHILYVNSSSIFAVPFDVGSLEITGSAVPVIDGVVSDGAGSAQFSTSSNGVLLYRQGIGGAPVHSIEWVDQRGVRDSLWRKEGTYAEPRVSPDGTKLSLMQMTGEQWDVWVYDIGRDVATRLTFDESFDGPAVWSPDGQYLVYSSNADGPQDLYRKRADGSGEVERITDAGEAVVFISDWSRDGKYLIANLTSPGGGADIGYLEATPGAEMQTFLSTEFQEFEPMFSPDGRWVAYQSNESGLLEIYVRPFPPSGGKWQISDGGGAYPRWSPDGRQLFYRTDTSIVGVEVRGEGSVFTVGRNQQLFSGAFRGGMFGLVIGSTNYAPYDIAPDGRFVMFPDPEAAQAANVELATMVTGWFEELTRRAPAGR